MELIKIKDIEIEIKEIENYNNIINEDDKEYILKTCSLQNYDNKNYIVRNLHLEENVKKYKTEELTADFIPTTETLLKEIKIKDEEQLKKYDNIKTYNREMIQRVKCIGLNKLGLKMLSNVSDLSSKNRIKLLEIMKSYNDIDHLEIIKEFNELTCDEIFDKNIDITKLPIYDYN